MVTEVPLPLCTNTYQSKCMTLIIWNLCYDNGYRSISLTHPEPSLTEEEIDLTGYKPVKHLKEDQNHLRSLLNNPNLVSNRKFNVKGVLDDALQFLDMREKFWSSQWNRSISIFESL